MTDVNFSNCKSHAKYFRGACFVMTKAAIKLGRDVLQLNLKGAVEFMQIKTLLNNFAHKLMSKIKEINIKGRKTCTFLM